MASPTPHDQALDALAHPLRARLLAALREGGPATSSDLARTLVTNSGATSYHLRRLAEAGLILDESAGRRRIWRAAEQRRPSWDDVAGDADAEAVLGWLDRDLARHTAEQHERWLEAAPTWPTAWRVAAGQRDAAVLVTAEQLASLQDELAEVLARYRRVGQGSPSARRVAAYVLALPLDVDRPAADAT